MSELLDDKELMAREPNLGRLRRAHSLLSESGSRNFSAMEELANEGSVMSMLYLAQAYELGAIPDHAKAEKWFKAAYEQGSSTALFSLGSIYYRRANYDEAERIFMEGVKNDDGPSMYWLAMTYLVDPCHRARTAEIKMLLENAIARGQVRAKYRLGWYLLNGRLGTKSIVDGLRLYLAGVIDAFRTSFHDAADRRLW